MNEKPPFAECYEPARIVTVGAAATSGLIFSVVFILFLGSQFSYHHPPFTTDTIGQMVGYAEFFVFAVVSYFGVALAVLRWKALANYIPSWLPIPLMGSAVF